MKKYVIQIVVIFISLILISNTISQKVNDNAINSLYFDTSITNSSFKSQTKKTVQLEQFINLQIKHLVDKEYDIVFNNLTENSKRKFGNSEEFGKIVLKKYFDKKSVYNVDRLGYYPKGNNYLFCVDIEQSYYLTEEEQKMEVYQAKDLYLAIYIVNDGNYQIEWDYSF